MTGKRWPAQRDKEGDPMSPSLRSMARKLRADAMAICEEEETPLTRQEQIAADLALVNRVKRGERKAFQEIYQRYAPSLLKRIKRMLGGDMNQAEDCLQQVFAQALQSLPSYQGNNVLHAWLNRLTTFIVADEFRHKQSKQNTLKQFWWSLAPRASAKQSQAIPEQAFAREEVKKMIHQSLAQLNHKKRIAVVLCDLEGYSIEEAAAELAIAPGTVGSRLHHGRKELRTLVLAACRDNDLAVEDWLHG